MQIELVTLKIQLKQHLRTFGTEGHKHQGLRSIALSSDSVWGLWFRLLGPDHWAV